MPERNYMVIEHFKNRDAVPVYRRFKERGRMMPDGLEYVSSWVDEKMERCYQVMKTDRPELLQEWVANWADIVEFEMHPLLTSQQAAELIASRL